MKKITLLSCLTLAFLACNSNQTNNSAKEKLIQKKGIFYWDIHIVIHLRYLEDR